MEQTDAALQTALRVLTAVCARTAPEPKDVEELKHLAPGLVNLPIDELACAVINGMMEKRRNARAMRAPG